MNSPHPLHLILGAFVFLSLHLDANDLVQFPAGSAAWTVKVTNSPNAQTKMSALLQVVNIEATQGDGFIRSVMTYGDGSTQESWTIAGSYMMMTEDGGGTVFMTQMGKIFFVPFSPSSFDWIQPAYLVEQTPIDYGGTTCFHYKGPMAFSASQGPSQTATGEAWIDSKTLLPVALDDGKFLGAFTFHPKPTTPLVLPPKYKDVFEGYKNRMGIPKSQ